MNARIASDPVGRTIPAPSDYRSGGTAGNDASAGTGKRPLPVQPSTRAADVLPPLPTPPDPPGTMFAAAVIAGALGPKPETPADAFRRLGIVWRPPNSSFHLLDRTA